MPKINKQINKKSPRRRIEIADRNGSSVPDLSQATTTSERRMAGNRSRTTAEVRRRGSSRSHKSPLSVALARRNARFYARLELNGRKSYDDDASNASSGEREGEWPTKGEDDSEAAGSLAKWPEIIVWAHGCERVKKEVPPRIADFSCVCIRPTSGSFARETREDTPFHNLCCDSLWIYIYSKS